MCLSTLEDATEMSPTARRPRDPDRCGRHAADRETPTDAADMPPTAHRPRDSETMPDNEFQELLALNSSKTSLDPRLTEPEEISIY